MDHPEYVFRFIKKCNTVNDEYEFEGVQTLRGDQEVPKHIQTLFVFGGYQNQQIMKQLIPGNLYVIQFATYGRIGFYRINCPV